MMKLLASVASVLLSAPAVAESNSIVGTWKLKSFVATGKYIVEGDKVTHKIDVSWNEAWTGTDQIRFGKVEGNRLTITTAVNIDPRDGHEGAAC
jgi:hypothetical protein